MIVQINAFKRYESYESIIYAENWEQNTFHLSISKATKQFWKNRCGASKKIKSYYSKHFYLWRSFLHGQEIAMSEVTGLHDSENNDDFKFGLVVLYHDQWFGELCFSMPEAVLGEINPSTACSSRNIAGLSSRTEGRVVNTHKKFHRCWRWTQGYLSAADPPQSILPRQILISTSTSRFHFFLKASLKVSLNRY